MKLLIIGAGGVGTSAAQIIKRAGSEGEWAEKVVISDYNLARAEEVVAQLAQDRFAAEKIDAGDAASITAVIQKHGITQALNAVEPAFNETIFDTCYDNGVGYMDCAMTLSEKDPDDPYGKAHIKL
ncbi:MAG: saccharopine dehydrogenase NADP-binding domain-containing protein, partial [Clostridiales Family XIII bacterium]|nr:saccharopine dehydrogenase NADP-binding domain-containing protein [Clostridiales Family XIII bacterium]